VAERDQVILAQFRFLGIEKALPFKPDERHRTILADAVVVGEAMAEANISDTNDRRVRLVWVRRHGSVAPGSNARNSCGGAAVANDAQSLLWADSTGYAAAV